MVVLRKCFTKPGTIILIFQKTWPPWVDIVFPNYLGKTFKII